MTSRRIQLRDCILSFIDGGGHSLNVKLGDGEAKWEIGRNIKYDLDRGLIDTVRQGDDIPLVLTIAATWVHIKTGSGEPITPTDALCQDGGAAAWVSSSDNECEPYAVDVQIAYDPKCGSAKKETFLFPDFRYEKIGFDIQTASIAISGKCNCVTPTITRG